MPKISCSPAIMVYRRIVHGGGGATTRMLCGILASEVTDHPILRMLPRVRKVRIADAPSNAWIKSTMRLPQDIAGGVARSPALLGRLAELLFVEAVQRYLAAQPAVDFGWQSGITDRMVGRALALLHRRLGQRWTTEELARAVGMSRSACLGIPTETSHGYSRMRIRRNLHALQPSI